MTGEFPDNEIDHKDLDESNNKWNNLREATSTQNKGNVSLLSSNRSGIRGVSWDKSRNKWLAVIYINNKLVNLGRFDDKEKAALVYKNAAIKHFGEYARF